MLNENISYMKSVRCEMEECKSWRAGGYCMATGHLVIGGSKCSCKSFEPDHEYLKDEFHRMYGRTRCSTCGFELVRANKGWFCPNELCESGISEFEVKGEENV